MSRPEPRRIGEPPGGEEDESLAELYFSDPRLTLIPIEQLSPQGMSASFGELVRARRGWSPARVDLFNAAFSLYWERSTSLSRRTRTWPSPRLRHVAVVGEPLAIHPYAQLLNTSAWTLYDCDLDPAESHIELAAYLLVHGDRMSLTGEVTLAALHNAAYWFERTREERQAFAAAARRSRRPAAAALAALADAVEWLAKLAHETLRPPENPARHRSVPGTGLLVPPALAAEPPKLIDRWTVVAKATQREFQARWSKTDAKAVASLCSWLASEAPRLLLTLGERIVWDPAAPGATGSLHALLKRASGAAVRDVHLDLQVIDARTRAFLAAVPEQLLAAPAAGALQSGYSYMHRERRLIAYNLHEPGLERLDSPALPFARAMLGARTVHEWAHLAVDAGMVPCTLDAAEWTARLLALGAELDRTIAEAAAEVRQQTQEDLAALAASPPLSWPQSVPSPRGPLAASPGQRLARILALRLPDFQANLLAVRFLSLVERETYVRHNIRTLRGEYPPERRWRMLIRYLMEYQYLRFSGVADTRTFFVRSTWFDADFFATRALSEQRFDALVAAVARLCDAFAVDETRLLH